MTAALATSDNGCFVEHINNFLPAAFLPHMIAHVRRTQLTNQKNQHVRHHHFHEQRILQPILGMEDGG